METFFSDKWLARETISQALRLNHLLYWQPIHVTYRDGSHEVIAFRANCGEPIHIRQTGDFNERIRTRPIATAKRYVRLYSVPSFLRALSAG